MNRLFALIALLPALLFSTPIPESIRLKFGETREFQLPPHSKDKPLYLAFAARIDTPKWKSGAAPALELSVNGVSITNLQLVNKGDYFHYQRDIRPLWCRDARTITIAYYPWDKATQTLDGNFVHDFVFDITNMMLPADNHLILRNAFGAFAESAIEIRNIRLTSNRDFPIATTVKERAPASHALDDLRRRAATPHRGTQTTLQLGDDFDLTARPPHFAPRDYRLPDTAFTLQDHGDGTIELRNASGPALRVSSRWLLSGQSVRLQNNTAHTDALAIKRTVKRTPFGITVHDCLQNTTDTDLPVVVDNAFTADLKALRELRLAGIRHQSFSLSTDNLLHRQYSMTPLVFLGYSSSAFGIYLEDDCYRNQFSAITVDDTLHLADDLFYLSPRSSYTFTWKLYPVPDGDYYTLLNQLRQDYRLFQNIPGLFGFIYNFPNGDYDKYYHKHLTTPEEFKGFLNDTGLSNLAARPYYPDDKDNRPLYGSEPSLAWTRAAESTRQIHTIIRKAAPDSPLLCYTDVHLIRTDGWNDITGNTKWTERLADSVVTNTFGDLVPYRAGWLYHVAPRLDNAAGRQILANFQTIIGPLGFDGFFLDEWDHSNVRVAYNRKDNYTAFLDQHGEIARKVALIPLYCREFQEHVGRLATENGRICYANQFDCLVSLMRLPIIHFAEPVACEENYLLRAAQASRTPLTLGCKRSSSLWLDLKYFLRYGIATCCYSTRMTGNHPL
ncbi:MAG: hypothetical protein IJS15_14750, partial [Victivallales bacterium]|nr:hypothetical protein [Victivallales bacterium]